MEPMRINKHTQILVSDKSKKQTNKQTTIKTGLHEEIQYTISRQRIRNYY